MNNLFSHIEYLLLSHDCVIVPGLGAFIAIVRPAAIDYDNGAITPPSRTMMFNQAITSDDGLLANSYARKYNLSFEEARQIIIRETAMLKTTLAADKELTIGNLGVLKVGDEDNLMFSPRFNFKAVNSHLGFETLNLSKESVEQADSDSTIMPEATQEHSTSYYQFSFRKNFTKVAVAVMIMAVITIAAILNPIPADNREQRASVVPVEAIIHPKTSGPEKVAEIEIKAENHVVAAESAAEETPENNHYLIVATFSSNKEALNYVARNESDNVKMEVVESRKVTRVAIASSNDKEQLRKQLNSRDVLSKYPNAWIWTRNQKS